MSQKRTVKVMPIVFAACITLVVSTFCAAQESEDSNELKSSQDYQVASKDVVQDPESAKWVLDLRVRDSETGYAVKSTVKYADVEDGWVAPIFRGTGELGRLLLELSAGHYLLEITAEGYRKTRTHHASRGGRTSTLTIMMSPNQPPQELRQEVLSARLFPGHVLEHGFVVEEDTGKPLEGVRVRLKKAQLETYTDARGYYAISVPTVDVEDPLLEPSQTDDIIYELKGYTTYVVRNTMIAGEGGYSFDNVEMERGTGIREYDDAHPTTREPSELSPPQEKESTPPPLDPRILEWLRGDLGAGLPLGTGMSLESASASSISLPTNIRVGLKCGSGRQTSTTVKTYAFEDYVQRGLDNEWEYTWHENSLKAGAVAYRSYGAFYLEHPV